MSGSYSRNLNHLWFLGSVVASWESPAVEFYYPALTPGVTHVAVNRTTAAAAFAALRDADAARLRANARRVADELLCPDCLADYWRLVVHKMRAYLNLASVVDDPVRLARVLNGLDFGSLKLAALDVRNDLKLVRPRFLTTRDQLLDLAAAATKKRATDPAPPRAPRPKPPPPAFARGGGAWNRPGD